VTYDNIGAPQSGQHSARYLPGISPGIMFRDVLSAVGELELVSLNEGLCRANIGKRHEEGNIYFFVVFFRQSKSELLQLTNSLLVVEIHLPVASNKWGTRHEAHILSKITVKPRVRSEEHTSELQSRFELV